MTCEDVRQISGGEHCSACHDESDEGYGELCEIEIDGVFVAVCCTVARRYNAYADVKQRATPCYCDTIGRALCPQHRATG